MERAGISRAGASVAPISDRPATLAMPSFFRLFCMETFPLWTVAHEETRFTFSSFREEP
jgi:hypothetical protein